MKHQQTGVTPPPIGPQITADELQAVMALRRLRPEMRQAMKNTIFGLVANPENCVRRPHLTVMSGGKQS